MIARRQPGLYAGHAPGSLPAEERPSREAERVEQRRRTKASRANPAYGKLNLDQWSDRFRESGSTINREGRPRKSSELTDPKKVVLLPEEALYY